MNFSSTLTQARTAPGAVTSGRNPSPKPPRLAAVLSFVAVSVWVPAAHALGSGEHSALNPAGPQAKHIASLWWLIFYVCAAIFVVVMALLAYATWRRRSAGEENSPPRDPSRALRNIGLGLGATVVTLFVFLVASVLTDRRLDAIETTDALTLTITGHQWWWDVRYENKQPSNLVTTANEIHIPVGRPVQFNLKSADVIHSFWMPSLNGKRDLIPGHDNQLWLQADHAGTFDGICAEYCGLQHAHMQLRVVAETEGDFQKWFQAQRSAAREPSTARQQRGREVFLAATCVMCHAIQGTSAGSRAGPDLTHFGSRSTLAAGALPNTREHLARWVLDPQTIKPGTPMPARGFDPRDLDALVDYLMSLE